MNGWRVDVDADLGGRWRTLLDPSGRQWLWQRPDPARASVVPGQAFVDVGGLEECFPTIGGEPDHGDVWSRPWHPDGDALVVEASGCRLRRTVAADEHGVVADYRLDGPPGTRFVWAAHALVQLDVGARFLAPDGSPVRAWPDHVAPWVAGEWPRPAGVDYAEIGADDGSAMFVALPGLTEIAVADGRGRLRMRIEVGGGHGERAQPVGVGLWRNLGGYPWDGSPVYRNIAVEPMLGHVFDLSRADAADAALIPASGQLEWRLSIDNG